MDIILLEQEAQEDVLKEARNTLVEMAHNTLVQVASESLKEVIIIMDMQIIYKWLKEHITDTMDNLLIVGKLFIMNKLL